MGDVVHFRGGRREADRIIRAIIATLTGHGTEHSEAVQQVFHAVGFAALSDIQGDFVKKARGETGADGTRWPRLNPKTLAYSRRFGAGEKSKLKKDAGLGSANRFGPGGKSGLLTAQQVKRWRQIYGTRLARLAASMPISEAKVKAAQIAWATLKAEGAKTKLEVYGNRPHEVLRDTGVLLNSLSMGERGGSAGGYASYSPPSGPGGDQQVFRTLRDGIVVGTNVPYARIHNEGDPSRGIPARRFIPKDNQVPDAWLQNWLDAGMQALANAIKHTLQAH